MEENIKSMSKLCCTGSFIKLYRIMTMIIYDGDNRRRLIEKAEWNLLRLNFRLVLLVGVESSYHVAHALCV